MIMMRIIFNGFYNKKNFYLRCNGYKHIKQKNNSLLSKNREKDIYRTFSSARKRLLTNGVISISPATLSVWLLSK